MALDVPRVGDPARVRRPRGIDVARRIVVRVAVDLRRLPRREVERPEAEVIVLEEKMLAVRRPDRREVVRGAGERDGTGLRETGLIADHELILTRDVGEPRELR